MNFFDGGRRDGEGFAHGRLSVRHGIEPHGEFDFLFDDAARAVGDEFGAGLDPERAVGHAADRVDHARSK